MDIYFGVVILLSPKTFLLVYGYTDISTIGNVTAIKAMFTSQRLSSMWETAIFEACKYCFYAVYSCLS